MNINYEYYKIFYYAAKYRNLTEAARIMRGSQPNISRAIKLLEHELGCRLIVRSNRGITLTPEGEHLFFHVRAAVEQLQTAEEEIVSAAGFHDGTVTIGVSETALHLLLLPALNRFQQKYPHIRIRIMNHLTAQAIESIKNGLVDFAVIVASPYAEKTLLYYPVTQFQDIPVGGASYSFLADKPVSIRELSGYPLVCLAKNTMTYAFYERFYQKHGLKLQPELEAATTDQILLMIQHNLGIGFLPEILAQEALEKKEVYRIPLTEEIPKRQICLLENKNYPLSIAAAEFKHLLLSQTVSPTQPPHAPQNTF